MNFRKPLSRFTSVQIAQLFRHAQEIQAALADEPSVVFPAPLSYDVGGINYEFVELPPPLTPQLQERTVAPETMRRIGQVLRLIHSGAPTQGITLLHGDFVPHNVFYDEEKLYIIDPHPPENLPFDERMLYGDPRRDVTAFVFGIFSNAGLKHSLKHYHYYKGMAHAFLAGYGHEKPFIKPLLAYAADQYAFKRRAGFSSGNALAHCILGCMLTLNILILPYATRHISLNTLRERNMRR